MPSDFFSEPTRAERFVWNGRGGDRRPSDACTCIRHFASQNLRAFVSWWFNWVQVSPRVGRRIFGFSSVVGLRYIGSAFSRKGL